MAASIVRRNGVTGVYSILSFTKTKISRSANHFGLAENGSGHYLEGARNKLGSRGAVALRGLFFCLLCLLFWFLLFLSLPNAVASASEVLRPSHALQTRTSPRSLRLPARLRGP